MILFLVSPEM